MFYPKEFKEAIHNLSSLEKDKLIFRLLKKDLVLANRLIFELVDTDTVEQKRQIIEKEITKHLKRSSDQFYSLGYFLMEIRFASGKLNHYGLEVHRFG